jgi:thiamine-phosphate pyrophosphorylase
MTINKIQGIYAITDPNLLTDNILYDSVSQAIDAGISILQYRNKTASYDLQQRQAEILNVLCKNNQVLFIINDSVQLARKVSADGVHLGKEDKNISQAREKLGESAIIGISCYNQLQRAIKAEQQGADYIAFGRFFPSKTKPHAISAIPELITQARKQISIPIVAIGGITAENANVLIKAGADSLAVINGIFAQKNTFAAAADLIEVFKHEKSLLEN